MTLREFTDRDIAVYSTWLNKKHVRKWYGDPQDWLIEVESPAFSFIRHYIVEEDGYPIGFCQYYDYSIPGETWHGGCDIKDTFSIDYLIGEEDYLGKGYGSQIIRELTEKVFAETTANKIIVQPEEGNLASNNALQSAGYSYDEKYQIYIFLRSDLCS